MSRIGKKPIVIPPGVTVTINGKTIAVKGSKGELKREIHNDLAAEIKGQELLIIPQKKLKRTPALWGLFRTLVANMIEGVSKGWEKKLEFEGIGFRAGVEGDTLVMQLGFSHPVKLKAPEGIKFDVEKNTITVSGINNELVGETAARIRNLKPPEPYKGKGIRYKGEVVRRKAGKKAVASAG